AEIALKLAQAADMATQGELQRDIARTLGISVMTLHRWRKSSYRSGHEVSPPAAAGPLAQNSPLAEAIAELQLENSRLRRLVIDLLLEKMRLEEEDRGLDRQAGTPDRVPPQAA
ncbi:MAG TPA: transposase, partial [Xanthobacteraceae bacterium]